MTYVAEILSNIFGHIVMKKWWKCDEFKLVLIFWPMMYKWQFVKYRHGVLLSDSDSDSESEVFRYSLFGLIAMLTQEGLWFW